MGTHVKYMGAYATDNGNFFHFIAIGTLIQIIEYMAPVPVETPPHPNCV